MTSHCRALIQYTAQLTATLYMLCGVCEVGPLHTLMVTSLSALLGMFLETVM